MASKRPAPSDNTNSTSSRKRHKHNNATNNPALTRPAHHGKKSFKKAHPINDLKSNIRSLRRLLSRNSNTNDNDNPDPLPPGIRIEKERALATAEKALVTQQREARRSEMIGRWHKVRFFERQKAERRLRKARKEGGEVGEFEVEVNYAVFFPLEREYVPLWPRRRRREEEDGDGEGEEKEKEKERQGDGEMWEVVRRCMREGTLKDLREGRVLVGGEEEIQDRHDGVLAGKREVVSNGKSGGRAGTHAVKRNGEESDNESGGGLFE